VHLIPPRSTKNQSTTTEQIVRIEEMSTEKSTYEQDGPEAKAIAKYLPYYPFKGIPRFYDIGGFLAAPEVFQNIVDIFASRYADIGIDSIAG